MNMLRMTPEQVQAHNARIGSARVIKGKCSAREESAPKPKERKTARRMSVPRKPRPKYEYEKQLALQLTMMGFTEHEVDVRYLKDRLHRADVLFRKEGLVVEIQGHVHRIRDKWERDIEKAQLTLASGFRLLPVSTKQVKTGVAADIVRRALELLRFPVERCECHGVPVEHCPEVK